ncbi:Zyxin [Aphelenchoides besseyi]|nr:Zyxin [Aphelenchoides besseyi]
MSGIPPAPPPPPPKSVVQPAKPILAHSKRPPANSNNFGSVRATETRKGPFAGVDNETLQRASARLRPTQYNQSILSRGEESILGRPIEVSSGGHRSFESKHDPLAEHQAGTTLHASGVGADQHSSSNFNVRYSVPINQQPQSTTYSSTNTYSTNYDLNSPPSYAPPPIPQNNENNQIYSSHTTYSYVSPPQQQQSRDFSYVTRLANDFNPTNSNYTQSSYQTIPTNGNGIQTYKTYTSTTSTHVGANDLPSNSRLGQNLIGNPKEFIHDFATRTPVAVLSPTQMTPVTANASNYSYTSTYRTTTPVQKPLTLTERQKQSNQFQNSSIPERQVPNSFHSLYEETTQNTTRSTQQVDNLIEDMEMRLRTGRDICAKCSTPIVGDTPGVTALGKPFHVHCFACDVCSKQLAGCSFYNVDGKNLCQVDYMNSLEKCKKCETPITQKILRALGQAFHPECFTCPGCQKSLDGIPFTVSKENVAYCLDCYHERFSPRCAACLKAIAPTGNETEVARVVALDKSYHVSCYVCEDCGLQLNSKIEGHACYPLESHLFCKNCNLKRLKAVS